MLGPIEALGPTGPVKLGGAKPRVLLAFLVMHADQFVPRGTLIDALWPEAPPASAAQTIESNISRLRSAFRAAGIGEETLVSLPGGYELVRDGNRFDHDEFSALLGQVRAALIEEDAAKAIDLAIQGLGLWRGPALGGVADERALRAEATALEDRRQAMLELWAEAKLAGGEHAEVIAELRAASARDPTRERIRELMMLALYRAGRQSEALDVYRDARDHLDRELGLEPGAALVDLQARILRHDPALVRSRPVAAYPQPGSLPAPASHSRRTSPRLLTLAIVLTLAVALVIVVVVREAHRPGASSSLDASLRVSAIGELASSSGRPLRTTSLPTIPSGIVEGDGAEWATSYDDGTLTRVDASTAAVVQTIPVGHGASAVAIEGSDAWVAESLNNSLARVSIATDRVIEQIPVGEDPVSVASGAGAIWVANEGSGTVTRVDPRTGGVVGTVRLGGSPAALAVGDRAVWVALQASDAVAELDPQTGQVVQTIAVGSGPSAVAVGSSGVWVANELDSTVSLIDPTSGTVVMTRAVAGLPAELAVVGRDVWVAGGESSLTMLTPAGRVRTIAMPSPATALAPDGQRVLVGVRGIGAGHRGGTLVVRIEGRLTAIDPAACCNVPPDVRALAYDSLLSYSKSPASPDTLVPDLALAIPKPRDHGLVYTFRLRPGLRYSTGKPVRASDFVRGFEVAARSSGVLASYIGSLPGALACPGARHCDLSRGMTADNSSGTVTLHLVHPDPDILLAVGLSYFAPKPPGRGIRPATGPYRVARFVSGVLIDFERNRYFRDWAPAAQPAGYPNRILVYSNGTRTSDIEAVLHGRADYTFDQPTAGQLHTIRLQYPGLLHIEPLPNTDSLDLNTRLAPFNDRRVRQALNYAVNRKTIVILYGGREDAFPTCQIIPVTIPGHQAYCPYTLDPKASGRWTGPDLARARQLVAASGTRGESVTVLTQSDSGPAFEPVAAYMVRVLRRLGYRARLRVVPPGRWVAALADYRHPAQASSDSWVADFPSATQWMTLKLACDAWRPPTELNNDAEFCDRRFDRLTARAAALQLSNPAAADALWARADRLVTNLAPWVPTVTENETDLVSSRVGDYQYVPTIGALIDQLWVR